MKKRSIELSIIIVEYKSGAAGKKQLKLLPKEKNWEIIVVDNNKENRGYGAGCNAGAQQAQGKYLLFLNPDVFIQKPAIQKLLSYLKSHKKVGVVGPKYLNAERKTEQCSTQHPTPFVSAITLSFLNKIFPRNRFSRNYWMKNWNRETTKEVDVVSGAAMMVRAQEFKALGKFDEQYFLYWEEFDLCKRYALQGMKSAYVAEAVAEHPRQVSVRNSKADLVGIFRASRLHYFQKFFGWIAALSLELWLLATEEWRVVVLFAWAFLLRIVDLEHITLIGDAGRDYLKAIEIIQLKEFSLLGIPSSIPRFSQGPLNVWFDALSFLFGGINPISPVLFAAALSSVGVVLLYYLLTKTFGRTAAFLAACIIVVAPAAVIQSRVPFYLFAVPTFLTIFLWRLHLLDLRKKRTIFLAVFSYWLLFQWEMATLPLLLLIPVAFFVRKLGKKGWIVPTLVATIVGLLPQVVYDLQHKCAQMCQLGAWAGYRAIAAFGFDGRHTFTLDKFEHILRRAAEEFQRLFGLGYYTIFIALLFMIAGLYVFYRVKQKQSLLWFALFGSLVLLVGIVLHGDPSEAYFPPFLVFIPIIFASVHNVVGKRLQKIFAVLICLYVVTQSYLLLSHHFYARSIKPQIEATQWILKDARTAPILLKSYDTPAQTPTYLDNYRFLVEALRTQPINSTLQPIQYVVSQEDGIVLPSIDVELQTFEYVRVVRKL